MLVIILANFYVISYTIKESERIIEAESSKKFVKFFLSNEKWKEVEESFYDKLETTMFAKALTEHDNTMLIWLSKTKMKHRGYVEKVEQDLSINPFEKLMQELPDDEE